MLSRAKNWINDIFTETKMYDHLKRLTINTLGLKSFIAVQGGAEKLNIHACNITRYCYVYNSSPPVYWIELFTDFTNFYAAPEGLMFNNRCFLN